MLMFFTSKVILVNFKCALFSASLKAWNKVNNKFKFYSWNFPVWNIFSATAARPNGGCKHLNLKPSVHQIKMLFVRVLFGCRSDVVRKKGFFANNIRTKVKWKQKNWIKIYTFGCAVGKQNSRRKKDDKEICFVPAKW